MVHLKYRTTLQQREEKRILDTFIKNCEWKRYLILRSMNLYMLSSMSKLQSIVSLLAIGRRWSNCTYELTKQIHGFRMMQCPISISRYSYKDKIKILPILGHVHLKKTAIILLVLNPYMAHGLLSHLLALIWPAQMQLFINKFIFL